MKPSKRLYLEINLIQDGSYTVTRQVFIFRKVVATCQDKKTLIKRLGEIASQYLPELPLSPKT